MQTRFVVAFFSGVGIAASVLILPTLMFLFVFGGGEWDDFARSAMTIELGLTIIAGWIAVAIEADRRR